MGQVSNMLIHILCLWFLIQSVQLEEYNPLYRGVPGLDFPVFHFVPPTSFSCPKEISEELKYYADAETGCQIFHMCAQAEKESFLCPPGTLFNQDKRVCDFWYKVNCQFTVQYSKQNALSKDSDEEINNPQKSWRTLLMKMKNLQPDTFCSCGSRTSPRPRTTASVPCPHTSSTSTMSTRTTQRSTTRRTTSRSTTTPRSTTSTTRKTTPRSTTSTTRKTTLRSTTSTTRKTTPRSTTSTTKRTTPRSTTSSTTKKTTPRSTTSPTRRTTSRFTTSTTKRTTSQSTVSTTRRTTPQQTTKGPGMTTTTAKPTSTTQRPSTTTTNPCPTTATTQSSTTTTLKPTKTTQKVTTTTTPLSTTTTPKSTTTKKTTTTTTPLSTTTTPKPTTTKKTTTNTTPLSTTTTHKPTTTKKTTTTSAPCPTTTTQKTTTTSAPCPSSPTTTTQKTTTTQRTTTIKRTTTTSAPCPTSPTTSTTPKSTTTPPCPDRTTEVSVTTPKRSTPYLSQIIQSLYKEENDVEQNNPEISTGKQGPALITSSNTNNEEVKSHGRPVVNNIQVHVNTEPRVKTKGYVLVMKDGNIAELIPLTSNGNKFSKILSNFANYSIKDNTDKLASANSLNIPHILTKRGLEDTHKQHNLNEKFNTGLSGNTVPNIQKMVISQSNLVSPKLVNNIKSNIVSSSVTYANEIPASKNLRRKRSPQDTIRDITPDNIYRLFSKKSHFTFGSSPSLKNPLALLLQTTEKHHKQQSIRTNEVVQH